MTRKYKLGDYVAYNAATLGSGNKFKLADQRTGFVNAIEDRMEEDGSAVVNYTIGQYVGCYGGYVVREEAIIEKLEAPKNKSKLEYLKGKIMQNESQIKYLNNENKSLRKEIAKLEKEELE